MNEIFKNESPNAGLSHSGERLTIGHSRQTELEHYHRYYQARAYTRGKDVLDIASGEGYGSALLAQSARSVIGVDVSNEAVKHASDSYQKSNLTYLSGSADNIPVEDSSIDVVVSFETLEHFYNHDAFMQEVKRVLRPDGFLILSTPDRNIYSGFGINTNAYHINELNKEEFVLLVKKYFKNNAILSQRTMIGSMLISDSESKSSPVYFEHRDTPYVEYTENISRAPYLISIASDSALPEINDSFLIDNVSISPLYEQSHFLKQENQKQQQDILRLKAIQQECESKLNAIYSSFWWRSTKWFRSLVSVFKLA